MAARASPRRGISTRPGQTPEAAGRFQPFAAWHRGRRAWLDLLQFAQWPQTQSLVAAAIGYVAGRLAMLASRSHDRAGRTQLGAITG